MKLFHCACDQLYAPPGRKFADYPEAPGNFLCSDCSTRLSGYDNDSPRYRHELAYSGAAIG